jgi:hypothetical protein
MARKEVDTMDTFFGSLSPRAQQVLAKRPELVEECRYKVEEFLRGIYQSEKNGGEYGQALTWECPAVPPSLHTNCEHP